MNACMYQLLCLCMYVFFFPFSLRSADFFFCFWSLPSSGSFRFFLLQVLPDIVHPDFVLWEFLGLLPGGDQSSPGRVMRPVGPKNLFRPTMSFQHLPPVLASFSGFLISLSTSRSALAGSLANGLHPWWHSPPDIPLLGCSPPHHYEVQVGPFMSLMFGIYVRIYAKVFFFVESNPEFANACVIKYVI